MSDIPSPIPTPEVPVAPVAGAPSEAAPAQPNPRAEIDSLASSLGLEPSEFAGFETAEAAKAAAKTYVQQAREAAKGYDPGAAPAPAPAPVPVPYVPPQPQSLAAPATIDFGALELDPESPAAKAIAQLTASAARTEQALQAFQEQAAAERKAQQTAATQARLSEAAGIVDEFKSPYFGVGNGPTGRNNFQQWNVDRLYDIADDIAIAANRVGRPIPPLRTRLSLAKFYFDQEAGVLNGNAPTGNAPAYVLPESSPPPAGAPGAPKLTDQWSQDPALRSALGI